MTQMSLSMDVVRGFELAFAGSCATPEDARTLAEAARGMLALARISLPAEERDLLGLLDEIEIRDSAESFEAAMTLDTLQVEDLMNYFESRNTADAQ